MQPNWLSSLQSPPTPFYLTQIQVLELELLLDPPLGLLCLLSEPQDCVPGSALVVEVTEEVQEEEEGAVEAAVAALVEVEEAEQALVALAPLLGLKAGGSFISQRERSSSILSESWM